MRILYNSRKEEYKTPFGTLVPEEVCVLHLRIPRDVQASIVELIVEDAQGERAASFAFAWDGEADGYDSFKCDFSLRERGLYFYWFRIHGVNGPFRLFKQGDDTNMEEGEKWQLSVVPEERKAPKACMGAVIYQIFPDRFCRLGDCDTADKLQPFTLREDWGGQPRYLPDENGEVLCNDFFGGNFRGIASKLDYLQALGVTILYLNPICMAFSNHRYDTCDYRRPDPLLGTEDDFRVLCREAHRRGMRVIVDGVYSHTGSRSVYFDREGRFGNGACSGESSPYYKWYTFRSFPDDYDCWWNFPTLPNVNELEPSYVDFIIENEDSVIAYWLGLGADGFRLDVVDELPDEFVLRFHKRLRALKPDALLIGEVWEDASNKTAYDVHRRYFVDRELSSTMNYPWQKAIIAFCKGYDGGEALGEVVMTIAENYPPDVLHCMMNLLGSHDTMRILTELAGDFDGDRAYQAGVVLSPEQRALGGKRLRMASFLQYALPGSPSIYYGDEAGMEGCKDPFCRGCFPWGHEDAALQAHYRRLGALKRAETALRRGSVEVLEAGGGRFVFARRLHRETLMCYVNHSETPMPLSDGKLCYDDGVETVEGKPVLRPGGCACVRV